MIQSLIEMAPVTFPLSYIDVGLYYFLFKNVGPNSLKIIPLKDSFYKQNQYALLFITHAKKVNVKS